MPNDEEIEKEKEERRRQQAKDLVISSVGLQIVVSVVLGAFLGIWLDKKFKTTPLFTLLLTLLGLIAGFWNAYVLLVKKEEKDFNERNRKK